ncbi:Ig-like domain-containing protein [Deinococcus arenicola]|uniref:Ig-like domain-containing protein n=1 Tax=Deinococcus arenicola TaxID=2994950 RepID=A0ABU4DUN9_9DEIO|nr:Ig-like domain-containing protein [Deinococcus sp. ZS9-10]MDV6375794.1 Ig-like domain-containing protein [Deinococcus sp. ZS9-10]
MKKFSLPLLSIALLLAACGGGTPQPVLQPAKDTTVPIVALTAAQSGSAVNLSATASDNVAVTKVEFYRGSTLLSTDTTSPYAATDTVSAANNGNVTYAAKAYDAAGNVGQNSKTVAVNVTPAPGGKTLYQGVWGWGIVNPATNLLIDNGIVVFNGQGQVEGRTVGEGPYINVIADSDQPGNRAGFAALGPISAAGKLDAVFSLDTTSNRIYFAGSDANNALELYEGQPVFEGSGAVVDASNKPAQSVIILLIQVSDTLPTAAGARQALNLKAKALTAAAVKASLGGERSADQTRKLMNPGLLGSAQQLFRSNR